MEFNQLLNDTKLTTKQTAIKYKDTYIQNGYMDYIQKRTMHEIENLKSNYPTVSNDANYMKAHLSEYLSILIPKIKEEYGALIPPERIDLLEGLLDSSNVVVINDQEDKHDFSADTEKGQVIVNLAKMRGADIYEKVINAKGLLPHETFHLIIQMLKGKKIADERMIIDLVDDNQIKSRGMVGFMLNEGMVEKFSTEFCAKNNFYFAMSPQYIPYVNISNYILNNNPASLSTVFSTNYEEMLSYLNEEEKQAYLKAECISYAVRHKGIDPNQIKDVSIQKIELDNNLDFTQGLSKEQLIQIREQLVQVPTIDEEIHRPKL